MSYLLDYSNWTRLFEQATADTSSVEKAMIDWWTKRSDKEESAKKSLEYWNGQIDQTKLKYTDNLITHLTTLSKVNTVFNKDTINRVLDYVTKQKAAGVNIMSIDPTKSTLSLLLSTISKLSTNAQMWANTKNSTDTDVKEFNKPESFTQISKILESNKKIMVAMTPQDKADVVAKITKLAAVHAKNKGESVEESINNALTLWLRPVTGTSTVTKTAGTPNEIVNYEFSYPDKGKPEDALMQNFFDDNESVPTPEQVENFTNLVKTAISEVTKSGATITGISYYAGGITSKVGTKYLGQGKMDTAWKSENNIPLVNDRIKNLNEVVLKALTDNTPVGTDISKGSDESSPNTGPGWYEYSTKNSEGSSVYTYGPLYEAARKTNRSMSPKEFYVKRDTDSTIKAEYDEVFGKYRGSYGAFTITAESSSTEPSDTIEISASGKWNISIGWKYREPFKFNFKLGASGGGGKVFAGGASPTDCWNN